MSRFSTALSVWLEIEQPNLTIRQLSSATGIATADLSRIRAGTKAITFEALSKLLPVIKDQFGLEPAVRLLICYLWDEVPAEMVDTITISPRTTTIHEVDPEKDPVTAAVNFLAQRCEHNAEFAEWLIQLHSMLTQTDSASVTERRINAYRSSKSELQTPMEISPEARETP